MKRITVTLDKSEKYLDKQRLIEDNNGVKRPIDGFKLCKRDNVLVW